MIGAVNAYMRIKNLKRMILISLFAALFSIIFPIIIGLLTPFAQASEEPIKEADISAEISVVYTSPEAHGTEDGAVGINVLIADNIEETDMHSYLVGVYRGTDAFWLVRFDCEAEDYADERGSFLQYAVNVTVP